MRRVLFAFPILTPILFSSRHVATYPSPGTSRDTRKGNQKKYNFLNNQRLVEAEKGPKSKRAIRVRDDVFYHRRNKFREKVTQSIEEHIRYFPDNVKRFVFYKNKSMEETMTAFNGMRKAPGCVVRRILQYVENEILKRENRKHLIELIESTGTKPPSKEEWRRYTDKKTGEININIYYHQNVEKLLRDFCTSRQSPPPLQELQAFLLLNRNNFDICPPMRSWSVRQGPIKDEELIERGRQKEIRDMVRELAEYQRPTIMRAFEKLKPEERKLIFKKALNRREELRRTYELERLFGAKLMCGVTALKEVRALTSPAITYYNQEYYKYIIQCGGSVEATLRKSKEEIPRWFTLSKDARLKFYCFERTVEMRPVGGAHLYIRYGARDYGLSREELVERWASLSDLQKAALNFCFYAPISTPPRSLSAFRRFYFKQCFRHGLIMSGKACANRAFLARIRNIWNNMNADERAKFEDTESFASVFPLHPPKSSLRNGERANMNTGLITNSTTTTNGSHNNNNNNSNNIIANSINNKGEKFQLPEVKTQTHGVRNNNISSNNNKIEEVEEEEEENNKKDEDDDIFYFEDEAIEDEEENNNNDNNTPKAEKGCKSHKEIIPEKEENIVLTV